MKIFAFSNAQYATGGAFMRGMALSEMRDGETDLIDSGYCIDAPECLPIGSSYCSFVFAKPCTSADMRPGSHS